MASKVYTLRYAQAVFEIALKTRELDRWRSDLRRIASLGKDDTLITFLGSPKIKFEDKAKLISGQLPDINPLALNLVYLLVDRGRLAILNDIVDGYQRLLDNYIGIETAEVTTAIPLTKEDKRKLVKCLSAKIGRKVELKTEVDPGLIGGITVRIGGKLLDGSTCNRLEALKKELAKCKI